MEIQNYVIIFNFKRTIDLDFQSFIKKKENDPWNLFIHSKNYFQNIALIKYFVHSDLAKFGSFTFDY